MDEPRDEPMEETPGPDAAQLLVRYYEIVLKGKNRRLFTRQLLRNLRLALGPLVAGRLRLLSGRIAARVPEPQRWPGIRERLSRLYGIANFSLAWTAERSVPALCEAIWKRWPAGAHRSFRITCRRADKSFGATSPEIEREVGRFVQAHTGLAVDLGDPELNVWVEVLKRRIYYYFGKEPGAGGLPTGSSGRVVALLSGGIDSPVAAARMMRRGARVIFVHFSGQPFQDRASERKSRRIVENLVRSQLRAELHVVAFGEVQRRVVVGVPEALRIVVYRRLMLRIAEALARESRARALVTGESLGQVASQTLSNLAAIDHAATVPVLRPLIGMDKQEIVDEAKVLGTYEISILPDRDCCQLFVPRSPATVVHLDEVLAAEAKLDGPALVRLALDSTRVESFRLPPPAGSRGGRGAGGEPPPSPEGLRGERTG